MIWDGTGRNAKVAEKDPTFQGDSLDVLLIDEQGRRSDEPRQDEV